MSNIYLKVKTSCCNLKIRGLRAKLERNYDVLKSKNPCILLNKNINLGKIETESKIKPCASAHIRIAN